MLVGDLPYPEGKSTEANVIRLVFALSLCKGEGCTGDGMGSGVLPWLQELLGWVLCCSCPAPPVPNKLSPDGSVNACVECEK